MYLQRSIPPCFLEALELRLASRLDTPFRVMLELLRAARSGGIHFIRSERGFPICTVAFAQVDGATLRQTARRGLLPPYEYEWSSGSLCLVHDIVILPGWSVQALAGLRAFLRSRRLVSYLRRGELRVWRRRGRRHYSLGYIRAGAK